MAIFTAIAGFIGTAIVGAIGLTGATIAGVSLASIVGSLVVGAALLGLSALLTPKPPKFDNPSPQYQAVVNQAAGPRRRGYGRVKVGGIRAFYDSKDGTLYQIVMLHSGEIDAFEEYYLGDKQVTLGSGGLVAESPWGQYAPPTPTESFARISEMDADLDYAAGTIADVTGAEEVEEVLDEFSNVIVPFQPAEGPSGPYIKIGASGTGSWGPAPDVLVSSYATIYPLEGTAGQAALSAFVSAFSGVWTNDHRLRGIALVGVVFRSPPSEEYLRIFPEGAQTPTRVVSRLTKVLDPRTSATAWSDNPALCILDYLTHPDGYRLDAASINTASFISMANLCDEAVALAAGGTEPRYRLGGLYSLNDDPKDVLVRMLATCDGEIYEDAEGKLNIRGGEWTAPTVTIEDVNVQSFQLEEGSDAFSAFNQLKILYTEPNQDYQPTEAAAWDDFADQALRGVVTQDFSVDMCQSPSQARRLAKIFRAKQNPRWRGTISTDMVGLRARGQRTITLILPELDINDTFFVTSHAIRADLSGCEIGIVSLGPSAYAWNPATEEGQSPPIPQSTTPSLDLPIPTGLLPRVESRQITSATVAPLVIAEVNTPTRDTIQLEAQIRLSSVPGGFEAMSVASGSFEALSNVVIDGETYSVRARFRTGGAAGPWTDEEPIVITANPTAPDAPTGFTAIDNGDDADLAWTNPSANFFRSRVFRSSTDSFGGATAIALVSGLPGLPSTFTDPDPGSGTWYYWVFALNESNIASSPAGSEEVTIT
jgi:hypothetical protein